MGIVSEPVHMDDLDPYFRKQRLLGLGVLAGAVAGGVLWSVLSLLVSPSPAAWAVGAAAWGLVAVAGLMHLVVGAGWVQARAARRMIRRGAA